MPHIFYIMNEYPAFTNSMTRRDNILTDTPSHTIVISFPYEAVIAAYCIGSNLQIVGPLKGGFIHR